MRGQVYITAASLKIAGMAAGAALAGPLAGRSATCAAYPVHQAADILLRQGEPGAVGQDQLPAPEIAR